MKNKLDKVVEANDKVKKRLDVGEDKEKDKKKVIDEDEIFCEPNPLVIEETLLKSIKYPKWESIGRSTPI